LEPEREEGKKAAVIQAQTRNFGGSDEEVFGRLLSLEWCKYSNSGTTTLSHPRECLCFRESREVAETSALADLNDEPISCIAQPDDFRVVCLITAVQPLSA